MRLLETHGNASDIGTAEYAHKRAIDEMDREITYINCMTTIPFILHIPHFDSDRICIQKALETVGLREKGEERILRIHNTLDLGELLVSEAYLPEIEKRNDLSIVSPATEMQFDKDDDLPIHF